MHHDQRGPQRLRGPADTQVERAVLLFEVGTPEQDGACRLEIVDPAAIGHGGHELWIETVVHLGIDVI